MFSTALSRRTIFQLTSIRNWTQICKTTVRMLQVSRRYICLWKCTKIICRKYINKWTFKFYKLFYSSIFLLIISYVTFIYGPLKSGNPKATPYLCLQITEVENGTHTTEKRQHGTLTTALLYRTTLPHYSAVYRQQLNF